MFCNSECKLKKQIKIGKEGSENLSTAADYYVCFDVNNEIDVSFYQKVYNAI